MMDPIALKQLSTSFCAQHLKKIGLHSHHGFIIMLSSIHSKKSSSIGEFLDLIPLIKWGKKVGFDFLQLLPITDSGDDNSPYNPISTLALNPTFLSLHALPFLKKDPSLTKQLKSFKKTPLVQYAQVRKQKMIFLWEYFEKYFSHYKNTKNYLQFVQSHKWLKEYALFYVLNEIHKNRDWTQWPKKHQSLLASEKKALLKEYDQKINYFIFLQFVCFQQFDEVKQFAKSKSFHIMGDLPFLVSKYSCDAWSNPKLFSSDYTVGSPPDHFTPHGQNWEFPAYNWDYLKKSGYSWWKKRLQVAERLFDIYRLDHIIGFYRTWNIPKGQTADKGHYHPKDPSVWLDHGRSFIKMLLKASSLLPIGEDLVIPQAILDSLRDLGIPGTRILPFQRTGAGGLDFVPFELYTVASITHLASHDTETLAQWWHNNPKTAKEFALWMNWSYKKELPLENRQELLYKSHHTSSLFHANLLHEYLGVVPALIHKKRDAERINYPGTPSHENWRYRFIPSVEDIASHTPLQQKIKKILR